MTDAIGQASALAIFLNGDGILDPDRRGRRTHDESFLLMVNPIAYPNSLRLLMRH